MQCALIHISSDAVGLCVDISFYAQVQSFTKRFWMLWVALGYVKLSRSHRIDPFSSLLSFKISVSSDAVGCAVIRFCARIHVYDVR